MHKGSSRNPNRSPEQDDADTDSDAAHTDRDIDFYHWSSQSFGDFWKDALSVLMARERARIGLAASKGDWPRRIAEYARDDQEDAAAYAANY